MPVPGNNFAKGNLRLTDTGIVDVAPRDSSDTMGNAAALAVAGGTVSEQGGGKFANGAQKSDSCSSNVSASCIANGTGGYGDYVDGIKQALYPA